MQTRDINKRLQQRFNYKCLSPLTISISNNTNRLWENNAPHAKTFKGTFETLNRSYALWFSSLQKRNSLYNDIYFNNVVYDVTEIPELHKPYCFESIVFGIQTINSIERRLNNMFKK